MLRRVECDEVGASDGSYLMPRIASADSADLRAGALAIDLRQAFHRHGAVMLAVAAAAGGKAGIGVLGQGQCRCDGRKTNGGKQDEAEQTREHRRTRPSVRARFLTNKTRCAVFAEATVVRFPLKNVRELAEYELSYM